MQVLRTLIFRTAFSPVGLQWVTSPLMQSLSSFAVLTLAMRTCAYKEQTADTNCWMLSHFIGSTGMLTLWTAGLMKRLVVLNVIGVINWAPCAVLVYHVDSFVGQSVDCSLWKGHISRLLLGLQSTLIIVDTIGTSTYSVLISESR